MLEYRLEKWYHHKMTNNTSLVHSNALDFFLERYSSKNFRYLPAGDYDRTKNIWNDLCSKEAIVTIDDEFYVANVSHERLFPTIRRSVPDLNSILKNAKNRNSAQNTFYSLVGNFLRNANLAPEEIRQILAIEKVRYTLIVDMIENPNYPVKMLLDASLYEALSFTDEERADFEDRRKHVIHHIPKVRLIAYVEEQDLNIDLKALPVSTILAVLGN
jgi:hypothetical protein